MMKIMLLVALTAVILSNALPEMSGSKNDGNINAIAFSDTVKKDPETGMIVDGNFNMVKAQCTSCHSSKLIIANRFTRDGWKQKIRWMQANHNLWDLGETEKQVLDYLEKNYSPTVGIARRAQLKDIKWYKLDQK